MKFKSIIFIICIGGTWGQIQPTSYDDFRNLPPEIQNKLIELNNMQAAEMRNRQAAFQKKCEQNAGPGGFQKFGNALMEFNDHCVKTLVDPRNLKQEIDDSKRNGQAFAVFKKYCQKVPQFKICVKNLIMGVKPCFSPAEQKNLESLYNVLKQLADFVCFKDGEKITLFVTENGPECFMEKLPRVKQCLNDTLGSEMTNIEVFNVPEINYNEKECKELDNLQVCVVTALKSCPARSTADFVESLYKIAREASPCKDISSSASGLLAHALTMSAFALALLV